MAFSGMPYIRAYRSGLSSTEEFLFNYTYNRFKTQIKYQTEV